MAAEVYHPGIAGAAFPRAGASFHDASRERILGTVRHAACGSAGLPSRPTPRGPPAALAMSHRTRPRTSPPRRGAVRGLLVAVVVLVVLVAFGGCAAASTYNRMVGADTEVEARWGDLQSAYKRRYDLVPQLVETVKGAAEFERSTITEVTEARASVGRLELPPGAADDPERMRAYLAAQAELGSSLARLLATVENYPQLRATESFLSLQDQLEGTENRIDVARRDYIAAVQGFNRSVRSFPTNLVAGMLGFEERPQLEVEEDVEERPDFTFGER